VGLQVCRVDHHGLLFAVLGRQTRHHPGEDALIAPPLPAIIKRLVRAIGRRGVAPSQPIAVNEDNPTQHTSVIPLGISLRDTLPGSEREAYRGTSERRAQDAPSARPPLVTFLRNALPGSGQAEEIRHVHRSVSEP